MSTCGLKYFTDPQRKWTITDPGTSYESKGHEIKIEDLGGNRVKIQCLDGHSPFEGKYDEASDTIEGTRTPQESFEIRCEPSTQMKYDLKPSAIAPESWTAEDQGFAGGK